MRNIPKQLWLVLLCCLGYRQNESNLRDQTFQKFLWKKFNWTESGKINYKLREYYISKMVCIKHHITCKKQHIVWMYLQNWENNAKTRSIKFQLSNYFMNHFNSWVCHCVTMNGFTVGRMCRLWRGPLNSFVYEPIGCEQITRACVLNISYGTTIIRC